MSLNLRIFLAYAIIVGLAGYFMVQVFMQELKPGMRQSAEDTLVDTANMLAEIATPEFNAQPRRFERFNMAMQRFLDREYKAEIFKVNKRSSNLRVYITDVQGIVVFDTSGKDLGKDYSRWNDVYLTLRGQYGARSTKLIPDDEFSTVMHVAAPIFLNGNIVGSLTVAKPNFSVQPFINMAYQKIVKHGAILVLIAFLISLTIAFLLTRSIRKLVRYADDVSHDRPAKLAKTTETELAKLVSSIHNMKIKLEGKDYVEQYVHALTHELKSPVSAIKGASELLSPEMTAQQQKRFINNIQADIERIDDMINRLLALAKVEKQESLTDKQLVNLSELIEDVMASKKLSIQQKALCVTIKDDPPTSVKADKFLLFQAIDNLLQNAIDFSRQGQAIELAIEQNDAISIVITDQGTGIPDYAKDKLFDRFYSLARPDSDKKSSGLGLCFVKEIASLHGGSIVVDNRPEGGVIAKLALKN